MRDSRFDDIRPYYEEEIPAAMQRLAQSEMFPLLSSYVFPGRDVEEIRKMVRGFKTVADFQLNMMYQVNLEVIRRSISEFSYDGIGNISRDSNHLFVSNHRDIMLDASLLQNILVDNGFDTSEITFGANLMSNPLVIDIGKSNKMFRVERGGTARDFYRSSVHLSEYIRHAVVEKGQSVWIAQRNGRTKDGNDVTDQGIVKMFGMSKPDDKIAAIADLHIIPVAISYEWEPCDILKVHELYESSQRQYVKKPGEDTNSILSGILQQKGRVHLHFCEEVTESDLMQYNDLTSNHFNKEVARLLDKRICSAYVLRPNNFIAHDIRYGQKCHSDRYTPSQKKKFLEHLNLLAPYSDYDSEVLRDIMLGIYANPVDNYFKWKEQ